MLAYNRPATCNGKSARATRLLPILSADKTTLIQFRFGPGAILDRIGLRQGATAIMCLFLSILLIAGGIGCSCEDPEVKFQKLMTDAKTYKEKEDYKAARIALMSAIDLKPKDADAYFRLAEVLVHLQRLPEAFESYNTAINYNPLHREARLQLAAIALAGRQYEMAENHVTKLLEANPQDIEGKILQANLEAIGPRKNYKRAREILMEVLAKEPNNVSALASVAHTQMEEGNAKEAEDYLAKALKIDPKNKPLQMALADLYSRQGRLDEAQKLLTNLVEQNPDQTGLRYIFGEFLLRRGQSDAALEQYQKTIETQPLNHAARDRLYDMYLTRQKVAEAKALTASLVKSNAVDPGVAYFQGRDFELDGKGEEALEKFIDSIKVLNNFAPAFRRAGLIELALGKEQEGLEHLNQAVGIDPSDVGARLALARTLYAKGELSQATEHIEQILSRYPRQLGANLLRADIALVQGEIEKAREVYEFFVQAFPDNPSAFFKMGLLEEKASKPEKAVEWYEKTLKFDVNVLAPGRRYAMLTAQSKGIPAAVDSLKKLREQSKKSKADYDLLIGSVVLADDKDADRFVKAREYFARAVELNPNLLGAYMALGSVDTATGNIESAVKNYQALLEKNPTHVPTRMLLALVRERQRDFTAAADSYREILKVAPKFGPAANNLSYLLAEELNGDLDEALKYGEIAKEQMPKEGSVADTLGWIHFKRGSARAALPLLDEAIDLEKEADHPENAEMYYHLAAVKLGLEDEDGARAAIKKALALLGNNAHPKRAQMEQLAKKIG